MKFWQEAAAGFFGNISQSARMQGPLCERYFGAEEQLTFQGVEAAEKCTEILKKNGVSTKK